MLWEGPGESLGGPWGVLGVPLGGPRGSGDPWPTIRVAKWSLMDNEGSLMARRWVAKGAGNGGRGSLGG